MGGSWATNNVLFPDIDADYISVLSLWKFNKPYYYMSTFVFVYYTSIKSLFSVPLWVQMMFFQD